MSVQGAAELFEEAMERLRNNYWSFQFFTERDVVWTIQKHLTETIRTQQLAYRVFHDFPIVPGMRRSLCADIALLGHDQRVLLAVEFKYEPSHKRTDIWPTKFPIVGWRQEGVGKDIQWVQSFVTQGRAVTAYSIVIDEGGFFRYRPAHVSSQWID